MPLTAPWLLSLVLGLPLASGQSYYDACEPIYDNVGPSVEIKNGESVVSEIQSNFTHRWVFNNYNMSTMNLPDAHRQLIISLEPCYGIVYLFIRKNIPCHPDPYSCIDLETGYRDGKSCTRTHFMSDINGTMDGAPTFFQVSLSAASYYISVFAAEDSRYTLTVLDDIGAYPRRGNDGVVQAAIVEPGKVMLQWHIASYFPLGITDTKTYSVYAVRLLPNDTLNNPRVFIDSRKVLNTYCGILNNTDHADDTIPAEMCDSTCNTTLEGLLTDARYAFNVVVESHRGFRMAYAGITMQTNWESQDAVDGVSVPVPRRLMEVTDVPMDSTDMQVVGAVMGSVLGMVGMAGMVLLRFAS